LQLGADGAIAYTETVGSGLAFIFTDLRPDEATITVRI
jgi:hypothetical protein